MDYIIVNCPHCNCLILIYKNQINCGIFRHGVIKHNFENINPHLDKSQCDELILSNKIYGCGKPFRIVNSESAQICEYI